MSIYADEWTNWGGGRRAGLEALKDEALLERMRTYKRLVAKRYRVLQLDFLKKWIDGQTGQYYISTKIDGELWFLSKKDGEVALLAPNGRVIQGVPVVAEAEKLLADAPDVLIPGELFALPREGGQRPRVGHVAVALHDDDLAKTLGFRAFDVVDVDGEDWLYEEYEKRFEALNGWLADGKRCAVIHTEVAEASKVPELFDEWVRSGKFEGLVVRSEQGITYKLKPYVTIDAVVIAFGERVESGRPEVRELTLALMRDDGSWHILGTVGNGFQEDERAVWHKRLDKMVVESAFRMANREGTLCRFVRPEIIVEVKCSDLVETDSRDSPVRRMALQYDENKGWSPIGTLPIVSLIHPILLREREDKRIDVGDIGLDQVYQHVPFSGRDQEATAANLEESKILRREVFTKEMRGNVAVRKFVSFATNKRDEDPDYPEYVVFFTDFSPNRKDPLKTDIRVTCDKEKVELFVEEWLDSNIKKGWEKAEG